jgi:hypothetical protein
MHAANRLNRQHTNTGQMVQNQCFVCVPGGQTRGLGRVGAGVDNLGVLAITSARQEAKSNS